jgi:small subunit ribosomal protein S20
VANHKDALKRARQAKKARINNRSDRSELRTRVKQVREAIEAGGADAAGEALRVTQALLHKLAQKGVIHSNAANRQISRLATAVKGLGPQADSAA